MKRAVRTGVPLRVSSVTSTTDRPYDNLDPATSASRHDLVRAGRSASVDDDLDAIASHVIPSVP